MLGGDKKFLWHSCNCLNGLFKVLKLLKIIYKNNNLENIWYAEFKNKAK